MSLNIHQDQNTDSKPLAPYYRQLKIESIVTCVNGRRIPQTESSEEYQEYGVAAGGGFEQWRNKNELPSKLECKVIFNFQQSLIEICFSDDTWDWTPRSIGGKYKSIEGNVSIFDKIYVHVVQESFSDDEFEYHRFSQKYILKIHEIERHVLYKRFSVKIGYKFLEDPKKELRTTEYEFDVSNRNLKFRD